jgi:hypothetical protein
MGNGKEEHLQANENILQGNSVLSRVGVTVAVRDLPTTSLMQIANDGNNKALPKGHKDDTLYYEKLGKGLTPA